MVVDRDTSIRFAPTNFIVEPTPKTNNDDNIKRKTSLSEKFLRKTKSKEKNDTLPPTVKSNSKNTINNTTEDNSSNNNHIINHSGILKNSNNDTSFNQNDYGNNNSFNSSNNNNEHLMNNSFSHYCEQQHNDSFYNNTGDNHSDVRRYRKNSDNSDERGRKRDMFKQKFKTSKPKLNNSNHNHNHNKTLKEEGKQNNKHYKKKNKKKSEDNNDDNSNFSKPTRQRSASVLVRSNSFNLLGKKSKSKEKISKSNPTVSSAGQKSDKKNRNSHNKGNQHQSNESKSDGEFVNDEDDEDYSGDGEGDMDLLTFLKKEEKRDEVVASNNKPNNTQSKDIKQQQDKKMNEEDEEHDYDEVGSENPVVNKETYKFNEQEINSNKFNVNDNDNSDYEDQVWNNFDMIFEESAIVDFSLTCSTPLNETKASSPSSSPPQQQQQPPPPLSSSPSSSMKTKRPPVPTQALPSIPVTNVLAIQPSSETTAEKLPTQQSLNLNTDSVFENEKECNNVNEVHISNTSITQSPTTTKTAKTTLKQNLKTEPIFSQNPLFKKENNEEFEVVVNPLFNNDNNNNNHNNNNSKSNDRSYSNSNNNSFNGNDSANSNTTDSSEPHKVTFFDNVIHILHENNNNNDDDDDDDENVGVNAVNNDVDESKRIENSRLLSKLNKEYSLGGGDSYDRTSSMTTFPGDPRDKLSFSNEKEGCNDGKWHLLSENDGSVDQDVISINSEQLESIQTEMAKRIAIQNEQTNNNDKQDETVTNYKEIGSYTYDSHACDYYENESHVSNEIHNSKTKSNKYEDNNIDIDNATLGNGDSEGEIDYTDRYVEAIEPLRECESTKPKASLNNQQHKQDLLSKSYYRSLVADMSELMDGL
eukprot:Pgem_evm1s3713